MEVPDITDTSNMSVSDQLTRGSLLARNTVLFIASHGITIIVALVAVPLLIKGLGAARFGVLTLAWTVIGYFSLFDLGLGRALTKLVADKLGANQEEDIPTLVWTCLTLTMVLGVASLALVTLLSPWLVYRVLKISEPLRPETLQAFYVLGLTLPIVISTAAIRGVLEAQQRFGVVSIVRMSNGVFCFLAPLIVLFFSSNLRAIVIVLAAGRVFHWLVYLLLCFSATPLLRQNVNLSIRAMKPMFHLGGWMTVSNTISPIMVYFDRFLIGASISLVAVAQYVAPYEIVTKLWIICGCVSSVLFPAFATSSITNLERTAMLFHKGMKVVFLALFPISLLIVIFAQPSLKLWLGEEFARESVSVLQWLAIGVFVNSVAQVAFALIQAMGRPDLTAKLHVIEFVIYIPILYWMVNNFGIRGAAIAWTLRSVIDATILIKIAYGCLRKQWVDMLPVYIPLVTGVAIMVICILPMGVSLKGPVLVAAFSAFIPVAWFLILSSDERHLLMNWPRKWVLSNGGSSSEY